MAMCILLYFLIYLNIHGIFFYHSSYDSAVHAIVNVQKETKCGSDGERLIYLC
jgi:hypothetical protein